MSLSAQGTRLNRRGLETRAMILDTAIRCLAERGAEAAKANLIAREAGVTWGTIQHQFGDTDGVWEAVIDHVTGLLPGSELTPRSSSASVARQVSAITGWLWAALDSSPARAVQAIRLALPRDTDVLRSEFPRTLAALARADEAWEHVVGEAFADLGASAVKLRRVRLMLPGAIRGLLTQRDLSSLDDPDEARRGLDDAVTAYLST